MKLTRFILYAAIALLGVVRFNVRGQSIQNTLQSVWDAGITNGAVGGGYWRSTTGNYNIASYDFLYNLTTASNALGAGLIIGGDYMWGGKGVGVWNDVKGGFALNYTLHPLSVVGYTNFLVVKVFAGDAVATPRSSNVGVGNIAFVGVDWSVNVYKSVNFHVAPAYQTRTGQGEFDRNYAGVQGFFSLKF
jgi:hypothetical protein